MRWIGRPRSPVGCGAFPLHANLWKAGGAEVEPWKLRDLRRTARSIMSRSGVLPDIAERVLGHVIPG